MQYDDEQDLDDEMTYAPRGYRFNPDPAWQAFVTKYETMLLKVATKYCSQDPDLREDAMQEARISLYAIFPQEISGYDDYQAGLLDQVSWDRAVDRYCRNVIRNSIWTCLMSPTKGNWYSGRTQKIRNPETGEVTRVSKPARYTSLDDLIDNHEMQIDSQGNVSWVVESLAETLEDSE